MSNSIRFMGIRLISEEAPGDRPFWQSVYVRGVPRIYVGQSREGTWFARVRFPNDSLVVHERPSRKAALDALRKEIRALAKSLGELKI